MEYHIWDTYEEPWCAQRQQFYSGIFQGTPCFVYDGLWDAAPMETYHSKFLNQVGIPTPVTISLGVQETPSGNQKATVRTCVEPDAESLIMRLYTILVEDHYPVSPNYSRNTFRTAAPAEVVSMQPGECRVDTRYLFGSAETQDSNLRVIAWAQEPYGSWPSDVHQTAIRAWPFGLLPETGDYNNDGDVDLDDYAELPACFSGPDPADPLETICRSAFDSDADEDVDLLDFGAFTRSFTGNP